MRNRTAVSKHSMYGRGSEKEGMRAGEEGLIHIYKERKGGEEGRDNRTRNWGEERWWVNMDVRQGV